MRSLFVSMAILAASVSAQAAEYSCKVYCKGPDGSTYVTVKADSASEAARIVDAQGHDICRSAGHSRATDSTMSSSQCSR